MLLVINTTYAILVCKFTIFTLTYPYNFVLGTDIFSSCGSRIYIWEGEHILCVKHIIISIHIYRWWRSIFDYCFWSFKSLLSFRSLRKFTFSATFNFDALHIIHWVIRHSQWCFIIIVNQTLVLWLTKYLIVCKHENRLIFVSNANFAWNIVFYNRNAFVPLFI